MAETSKKTAPDTVAIADRLRPLLLRLARELRREADAAGISSAHVPLLVALKYQPGIGVNELAGRERMTPAGMSRHVDKLVKAGWVTKTPNESDRRRTGLTLTEEGKRILRNVRSRRTVWLSRRLGRLSAKELAAIEAAIEPLTLLLDEDERP